MSRTEFFHDLFTANFSHAWERLKDALSGAPSFVKTFIVRIGEDEYKVVADFAESEVEAIKASGYKTEAFVQAMKDIESKLIPLAFSVLRTDIFAILNMAVSQNLLEKGE